MQQNRLPNQQQSWWVDALLLLSVLGGLFFLLLGNRPLFVPDGGRYAEIMREMVTANDYITPYLNGIKYFEKPILFYWLGAAAIKIAGLNLWSLRSVNALLGVAGCFLTYLTTRQLYDRTTGLLAAFILGTSTLYFIMAHIINLDLPVTVFLTTSLYAFLLGKQHEVGNKRRLYLWGMAIAAALAVLTKGLIGIVFPTMILSLWILLMNDWRVLKRLYIPSCLIIFLIVAAPWHILVGLRNPEFFYFYFIEQHFLRYATMEVGHYQPVWFFIPSLVIGFFPWIVFLPQTLAASFPRSWQLRHTYQNELFLLLWAFCIFAFFSFSKSKLIPYILPVIPPLSILTARYLTAGFTNKNRWGIRIGYLCFLIASIAITCLLYFFPQQINLPDPVNAKRYLSLASGVLCIGAIISCIYAYRSVAKALIITIATMWLFLLLILAAIPAIDTRTILPLATILKPILKPQDEVITYNQYYQDLPFYLERKVSILNWHNELAYGMQHQDTREWMIDNTTFWQRWHSQQRVFAIMSKDEYEKWQKAPHEEKFFLLGSTLTNVLVSNR